MPDRWVLLAVAVIAWVSAGSLAQADIWSPSTWLAKGNSKKNVSVSKASKKTSHQTTGHKPSGNVIQGLANTPHDFLARSRELMSPPKQKPSNNSVSVKKNSTSKPSIIKQMFGPPEPPPPPQTVKDWLSLKRPT